MKVTEEGDTVTYTAELGEIGLAPTKDGKYWYILFEGFVPMAEAKITSITFTKRDEYEREGWEQGHQSIAVRTEELE